MSMQITAEILSATLLPAITAETAKDVDVGLDLAMGQNARLIVQGIVIVSEENLAWDVLFWGRSVHGATVDACTYLGHYAFATTDAIPALDSISGWMYSIQGIGLPFQDLDQQTKAGRSPTFLHISLVPRGADHVVNKKIHITFFLSPEVPWSGS
jgi:hypothetical protein